MGDDTGRPSFKQRLEQYRAMAGDTAWDQIADDWKAGKFDADEARAYADILFPIADQPAN
jgi:hypothetical protein